MQARRPGAEPAYRILWEIETPEVINQLRLDSRVIVDKIVEARREGKAHPVLLRPRESRPIPGKDGAEATCSVDDISARSHRAGRAAVGRSATVYKPSNFGAGRGVNRLAG